MKIYVKYKGLEITLLKNIILGGINMINNITIEGHLGEWYVIDKVNANGCIYYLLESETYGDKAPNIITDELFNIIVDDVYYGFNDDDFNELIGD
jgi:hypothetical protein